MMTYLYEEIERRLQHLVDFQGQPLFQDPKTIIRESVPMEELDARIEAKRALCIVQLSGYEERPTTGLIHTSIRYERTPVTASPGTLPPGSVEGSHSGNRQYRFHVEGAGTYTLYERRWDFETEGYQAESLVEGGVIPEDLRIALPDGTTLILSSLPQAGDYLWETFARRVYFFQHCLVQCEFQLEFLLKEKALLYGDEGILEQVSSQFPAQEWVKEEIAIQVRPLGGRWVRGDWEEKLGLFRAVYTLQMRYPRLSVQESPLMTRFRIGG